MLGHDIAGGIPKQAGLLPKVKFTLHTHCQKKRMKSSRAVAASNVSIRVGQYFGTASSLFDVEVSE